MKHDAKERLNLQRAIQGEAMTEQVKQPDLSEDVEQDTPEVVFRKALLAIQKVAPEIPRTGNVDAGRMKYDHVELDIMLPMVRKVVNDHDCIVMQPHDIVDGWLVIRTTIIHVNGQSIEGLYPIRALGAGDQDNGAGTTYARRYALSSILGLATRDKDTDGGEEPEFISPEQAADLKKLIETTGTNEERFLKYGKISCVEEIPAASYEEAKNMIVEAHAKRVKGASNE